MKKFILYPLSVLVCLSITSCDKDFEEINQNPFSPTQTDIGPLFNKVVSDLRLGWDEQFYLHNEALYQVTQQAALTAETFQNINIGTEDVWKRYYLSLAHIREIERRLDEYKGNPQALDNVRAQLKIILAYTTFRITDLFGDIPFFDAGRGFEDLEYARPKFDSQEAIYKALLEDLQWAAEHINTFPNPHTDDGNPMVSFGDFDKLFFGNMLRWVKFANSLRLRHALRMVEKDSDYARPILQNIIENNLPVIKEGEDVGMWPVQQGWLRESVNWSFREHNKLRMGSNMWHQLSEDDATDGSGIFDPRAKIFFEPNNAGEWAAFPQIPDANTTPSGGIPYGQHRDNNYTIKGQTNIYSPFNFYLIRDEVDIPEIILTAAEVHFIKAECYLRGLGVGQNEAEADGEYTNGVVASLTFWQNVFVNSTIWVNAPPTLTTGQIFAVSNHPRISIFTSTNKLEYIYRQRWIDAFRQPWEAYSLTRRTKMTPHEGNLAEHYRFPYPPSEAENNPTNWSNQLSKMGEDSPKTKIWWIP
ncbi:MAG: hypothetical protein DHS20C18_51370 [Saprospiraceae bacterium]|nr:MAG: hypothetical protein DHS20C18_51370 [Saprospiraceae bacterium]